MRWEKNPNANPKNNEKRLLKKIPSKTAKKRIYTECKIPLCFKKPILKSKSGKRLPNNNPAENKIFESNKTPNSGKILKKIRPIASANKICVLPFITIINSKLINYFFF